MAYNEKYRKRAVEYKESGHTFKELKETFGIAVSTYYKWKEKTRFYVILKKSKSMRKRKIDPDFSYKRNELHAQPA